MPGRGAGRADGEEKSQAGLSSPSDFAQLHRQTVATCNVRSLPVDDVGGLYQQYREGSEAKDLAEVEKASNLSLKHSGIEKILEEGWVEHIQQGGQARSSQSLLEGGANDGDRVFVARRNKNAKEATAEWHKKERRKSPLEEDKDDRIAVSFRVLRRCILVDCQRNTA